MGCNKLNSLIIIIILIIIVTTSSLISLLVGCVSSSINKGDDGGAAAAADGDEPSIQPPSADDEDITSGTPTSPLIDILRASSKNYDGADDDDEEFVHVVHGLVEFEPGATPESWNRVLRKYEFLFVSFYADWCRFSKALEPNWRLAAKLVADNSQLSTKAALARVDCDNGAPLVDICRYYGINKYPTMTLFKHGIRGRGAEFRGSRAPEAVAEFVAQQARLPVEPLPSALLIAISSTNDNNKNNNMSSIKKAKEIVPWLDPQAVERASKEAPEPGVVIYGLFFDSSNNHNNTAAAAIRQDDAAAGGAMSSNSDSADDGVISSSSSSSSSSIADAEELAFKQVSGHFLEGPCRFFSHRVATNNNGTSNTMEVASITSYFLKEDREDKYDGPIEDFISLLDWVKEQCVPLVRELRFDNAEALTEEGLPFLVLFRGPAAAADADADAGAIDNSLEDFERVVKEELVMERDMVNFLHADGLVFSHPLEHLGKTARDLPLVALDNFVHVFGLPDGVDFRTPGVLRQFVRDLYSGKLHLDFHHQQQQQQQQHQQRMTSGLQMLDSVFKKLFPSRKRYSLLYKDEL